MIKYSDNTAATALVMIMDQNGIYNVLNDLYIELPKNAEDNFMKVFEYATFLRVLYNASYLNQTNSEKALKLLSEVKFEDGLKRYLPQDVVVAHKFGERELDIPDQNQIHDCGIVYVPYKPYIMCVMTRGQNLDKMSNAIGLISKSVYDAVQKQQ
jgi:beta-lactamase class A